MPEVSEMERVRRRLEKLEEKARRKNDKSLPKGNTPAQSFRLGEDHMAKLRTVAERTGQPQVDVLRSGIDVMYRRLKSRTMTD